MTPTELAKNAIQKYLHGGHGRSPQWLQACVEEAINAAIDAKKGKAGAAKKRAE